MKEDDKQKVHQLLDLMQKHDFSAYMNICYESIVTYPEQVTGLSIPIGDKLAALDRMIQHFAERDEFEKCSELNKIKGKIK